MAKGQLQKAIERVNQEIAFLTAVRGRLEAELNAKPKRTPVKRIDSDSADVRRAAEKAVAVAEKAS